MSDATRRQFRELCLASRTKTVEASLCGRRFDITYIPGLKKPPNNEASPYYLVPLYLHDDGYLPPDWRPSYGPSAEVANALNCAAGCRRKRMRGDARAWIRRAAAHNAKAA